MGNPTDNAKQKTQKERGILPWIPRRIQKWMLIVTAYVGACYAIGGGVYATEGEAWATVLLVLGLFLFGLSMYIGIKTNWLKKLDTVSISTKICGGIAVGVGAVATLAYAAILAGFVLVIVIGLVLVGLILWAVFSTGGLATGGVGGGGGATKETIGRTEKIQKEWFGDKKILIGKSGVKVGEISKAWFSDDQIIRDERGVEIGRITRSLFDKDAQIIQDNNGNKVGEIKTNVWGERVITDSLGNEIGKIKKEWGETVIKRGPRN